MKFNSMMIKTFVTACAIFAVSIPTTASAKGIFTYEQHPQEWCLAQNIYFEARGSSFADQVAVADVVINRTLDRRYPATICGVVQDGKRRDGRMVKNMCQFSWYCDGQSDWPTNTDAWVAAQHIAWNMLNYGAFQGITEGATHYHADYVNPRWAKSLQLVGRIGEHIFYRWERK